MQLIDNNALTTPGFEQVSTPFKTSFNAFNNAFGKSNTKLLSVDVKGADTNRDNSHKGTKLYIKAFTYSLDDDKARAANLLLDLFEQYGNFYRESYANQTAKQEKLLEQLDTEPELKAAVATIGAGEFIESMRQCGAEFKAAAEARVSARATQNDDDAMALAKDVHVGLRQLFRYIGVMQMVMPSAELDQLVAQINEVVDETKQTLLIKEGRRAAAKEQQQD